MRLENISKRTYQHSILNDKKKVEILELKPGQNKEVPDIVAKQWLKSGEIREYISPEAAKAVEEELKAENEALKKELEALKAQKSPAAAKAKETRTAKVK
ncbi:hypothetical protein IJ531_01935 [bacterium]|nr:hypothetical protein [bacterium]